MNEGENFWSRRRAQVAAEAQSEQVALEAHALAEDHAALKERPDDEILAELKLPDPDSLKMGDDFSVFMAKAVPDRIRRRALRTLWRSNPVLANVDSLVDYGQDFTDSAMAVENLQTAYQVGKGMLKHVEEMARQAEERENPPEVEEVEEIVEEDFEIAAVEDDEEDVQPYSAPETDEDATSAAPAPRRMKFTKREDAA